MERFIPLLLDIRTFPSCLAVEFPCGWHVAMQWKYACAQYAERADVSSGYRVQLLPDFPFEAGGMVRGGIYRSVQA